MSRRFLRPAGGLVLAACLLGTGCGGKSAAPGVIPVAVPTPGLVAPEWLPPGPPVRVLFVGNSLTSANDLPGQLQALAAAGGKRLEYRCVAFGGLSLDDHWPPGQPFEPLQEEQWDFLVLQQGPSTLPESRRLLASAAKRFGDAARELNIRTALYGVWSYRTQANGLDLACSSYREAAESSGALLLPAGEAWRLALSQEPLIELYLPDGLHPTLAGSYLAALVMVDPLAGVKPDGLPARLRLASGAVVELPEVQASKLQVIAARASQQERERAHGKLR
jgi:hypothetical protein